MRTLEELKQVYGLPLPELIFRAAAVHRAHHDSTSLQRCALFSVKTGAGANSIFFGEKLLTASNASASRDAELFRAMGLPMPGEAEDPVQSYSNS